MTVEDVPQACVLSISCPPGVTTLAEGTNFMGWVLVGPLGQAWDVHLACDYIALSLLPDLHGMMGLASHTLPFIRD